MTNDIIAKILKFLFSTDKSNHPIPTFVTDDINESIKKQNQKPIDNEEI